MVDLTSDKSSVFEQLMEQRRSVRAYLSKRIDQQSIESILTCARRAPSGANLQPGGFHVLTGNALTGLTQALSDAVEKGRPAVAEYSYFPKKLTKELKERQFAAGFALYAALGIDRRDKKARREQFARNYQFFDAPVGIVVTIDRDMGKGCFMDLGMALMSLFADAQSRGFGTCGIGALANHADVVHAYLKLPEKELVVCGIALGYPDYDSLVNESFTGRESLDSFASFYGF